MPLIVEGGSGGEGLRFAIVVSRFNSLVTERLLSGAVQALISHGVDDQNITVWRVPGSFEIPQAARKAAERGEFSGVICLGALIRGETLHFQLISEECAAGIQAVAAEYGIPVTFGVITAENVDQAVERAGDKSENRGWEAALSALEMANLYKNIT
jgi:6,7-dimethyl-8-ribityllumazine synthase